MSKFDHLSHDGRREMSLALLETIRELWGASSVWLLVTNASVQPVGVPAHEFEAYAGAMHSQFKMGKWPVEMAVTTPNTVEEEVAA